VFSPNSKGKTIFKRTDKNQNSINHRSHLKYKNKSRTKAKIQVKPGLTSNTYEIIQKCHNSNIDHQDIFIQTSLEKQLERIKSKAQIF